MNVLEAVRETLVLNLFQSYHANPINPNKIHFS